MKAFAEHKELKYIFTKANADANGRVINRMIDKYVKCNSDAVCFESLGSLRYLSAVKYASVVIGNSSSGLIEVPSFHIPTINIGDRQKGRIQAESVINCQAVAEEVDKAMRFACSMDFRDRLVNITNPYGDGDTSGKIVDVLRKCFGDGNVNLKKKFYDIHMSEV